MATPNFKVLIAGGSIAGLVLANMLEQLGIDFLVLEAYPEIAPQVGASIGFMPNGCRILDQIGCYNAIRAKLDREMATMYFEAPGGKVLSEVKDAAAHFIARHGYDACFIDRQMAIEVFYNHLKDKSKVLVNKRVADVKLLATSIQVTTQDGSTYTGDILVGADGVHSTVRKRMREIGDKLSPGYFPKTDQTDVTCDYICIFGISHPQKDFGFEKGSSHVFVNYNHSYLIIDGPEGRIYWFLFVKNERTLRDLEDEIPRKFTKQEEEALVQKFRDDRITDNVTFGDLYESNMSAVLTALPEFVCTKWHFGRITLVGDSAHKFNPISGQGGNSAIETAALLATEIFNMLKAQPKGTSPSNSDITTAFQKVQDIRQDRLVKLVKDGHKQSAFSALETPLYEFMARKILPLQGSEGPISMFAEVATPAERLPMLPMPKRPRFEPYHDELPAKPLLVQHVSSKVAGVIFAILLFVSKKAMRIDFSLLDENTQTFVGAPLRTHYIGIGPVDEVLAMLSTYFADSVHGEDPSHPIQFTYLLLLLMPVLIIWTVEGYRVSNRLNILSFPFLFGIAYQLLGIGIIAPLYFLLSAFLSHPVRATNRPVPLAAARSVLPATLLGYTVPTILMFLPYGDANTHQGVVALWQFSPLLVALLTNLGTRALEALSPSTPFDKYIKRDVPALRGAYATAFWLSAIVHVAFVAFVALTSLPTVTFRDIFANLPGPFEAWSATSWEAGLFVFVKYDFAFAAAALLLWELYSVWEVRRAGYTTTREAVIVALAAAAGQVLVGPGATYAAVWWWREGQWAREAMLEGRSPEKVL